jgi:hypothetical protein
MFIKVKKGRLPSVLLQAVASIKLNQKIAYPIAE